MDPLTLAALPALIAALGEHFPGLLVAAAMIYLYREQAKAITKERQDWAECEKQYIADYKELLAKLFTVTDTVNDTMSSLTTNIAVQNRTDRVGAQLDAIAAKIQSQEVKANGNAARGQGQTGRKAG